MQFKLSIILLVFLSGTALPVKSVVGTSMPPRGPAPHEKLKKDLAATDNLSAGAQSLTGNAWYKNKTLIYLSLLLVALGVSGWELKGVLSAKLKNENKPEKKENGNKEGSIARILRSMPPSPLISVLKRKIAALKSQIAELAKDLKKGNTDKMDELVESLKKGVEKALKDAIKLIDPLAKPKSVVDFLPSVKLVKGLVEENGHKNYKQIDTLIKEAKEIALKNATAEEAEKVNETYEDVREHLLSTLSSTEKHVLEKQKNTKEVAKAYEDLMKAWGTPVYSKAIMRKYFKDKLESNEKKFAKLEKKTKGKIQIGLSAKEEWEEDSSLPAVKKLSDFDDVFKKLEALRPSDGDRNSLSEKPWDSRSAASPAKVEEFTKAVGEILKRPWQLPEDEKNKLNEKLESIFIKSSKETEKNSAKELEKLIAKSVVSEDSGLWWASQ